VLGASARRPVVFQDHNLFPWKTVAENIEIGLKARAIPKAARREQVQRIIDEFDLGGSECKYPHELSGGMQQRVGLARAMVVAPDCLIMDEPFGSLDEHTKLSVREYFAGVVASRCMNAVHVTHDIDEAVRMCTRVVLIKSVGRIRVFDREGTSDADRRLLCERIITEMSL
jgi:NitT/TauT family transport system ATP-binding protein